MRIAQSLKVRAVKIVFSSLLSFEVILLYTYRSLIIHSMSL